MNKKQKKVFTSVIVASVLLILLRGTADNRLCAIGNLSWFLIW